MVSYVPNYLETLPEPCRHVLHIMSLLSLLRLGFASVYRDRPITIVDRYFQTFHVAWSADWYGTSHQRRAVAVRSPVYSCFVVDVNMWRVTRWITLLCPSVNMTSVARTLSDRLGGDQHSRVHDGDHGRRDHVVSRST